MDANPACSRGLGGQLTIAPMILVIDGGGASIDAALCDMKWGVRDEQARAAWHSRRLGGGAIQSFNGSADVVIGTTARERVRKRRFSNE